VKGHALSIHVDRELAAGNPRIGGLAATGAADVGVQAAIAIN